MKKTISRWLLTLAGWKLVTIEANVAKCVVCVAPHTSNWDFILGKLFYTALGRDAKFLIKKEWFFFPFNFIFDWLGGVPVDRKKRTSIVDQMVEAFNRYDNFHLAVTPEGSRKPAKEWKRGFYHIALNDKVPIVMAYIDFGKKELGLKGIFYPTGNEAEDTKAIRQHYKGVVARHPQNFIDVD